MPEGNRLPSSPDAEAGGFPAEGTLAPCASPEVRVSEPNQSPAPQTVDAVPSFAEVPSAPESKHADESPLSATLPVSFPDPPPAAQAAADDPSPSLARYRPMRLHARGGLGEVHVAADEELNRQVAL